MVGHGNARLHLLVLSALVATLSSSTTPAIGQTLPPTVWTRSYDNYRDGRNIDEQTLTQANVNAQNFGKRFAVTVDGRVYAQPLYVPNVPTGSPGHVAKTENLLFVATMNNSVYAFDADTGVQYWQRSFGPTVSQNNLPTNCFINSSASPVGIMGTPVYTHNLLYFVARTLLNNNIGYQLHAVDPSTGLDTTSPPSPVTIKGHDMNLSVLGTGDGLGSTRVVFNPDVQKQRPALLADNVSIYIAFGMDCETGPLPAGVNPHGWILAYNAFTLALNGIFNTTPNGTAGSIWQSGGGLAQEQPQFGGHIYAVTGNGDYNVDANNFSMSLIVLPPAPWSSTPTPIANYPAGGSKGSADFLNCQDLDYGTSGPVISSSNVIVTGKTGDLDVFPLGTATHAQGFMSVDPNGNPSTDQTVCSGMTVTPHEPLYGGSVIGTRGQVFVWGANDVPRAYAYNNPLFNTSPTFGLAKSLNQQPPIGMSESSNDGAAGTEILWATNLDTGSHSYLFAFNADTLGLLWSSPADEIGTLAKWVPPTVVDGKVYVASFANALSVYANPPSFWQQNFGYQFNPLPTDWAPMSYKGECEQGKAITGLSAFPPSNDSRRQAHGVLCSGWVPTNASCQAQPLNSSLPGNGSYDWDQFYLKAECPANFYVEGVAQSKVAQLSTILCCPTTSTTLTISPSTCDVQFLFGQNSPAYVGPDWDNGYYKGQCPEGEVVAGVSELASSAQGPVGAPHALLCCRR